MKTTYKMPKLPSKYNKSEIMKQAHKLFREGGYTQAQALTESWRLFKIVLLENRLFRLRMATRMDWNMEREVRNQINELRSKAINRAA